MEKTAKPPIGLLRGLDVPVRKWYESLTRLLNKALVSNVDSDSDTSSRSTSAATWAALHSVTIEGMQEGEYLVLSFRGNISGATSGKTLWYELLVDGSVVGARNFFIEPTGSTGANTGNLVIPATGISGLSGDIAVQVRWSNTDAITTFYCTDSRFDWEIKRV